MRAVLIKDGKGPIENLYVGDIERPRPNEGQVLVKVSSPSDHLPLNTVLPDSRRSQISAFGLNRMDLNQREGMYPPPPGASHILGVEFSGIVHELGLGVTKWSLGDEVYGLVGGVWISESQKYMTEQSHDFFRREHTPSTLYATKVY